MNEKQHLEPDVLANAEPLERVNKYGKVARIAAKGGGLNSWYYVDGANTSIQVFGALHVFFVLFFLERG